MRRSAAIMTVSNRASPTFRLLNAASHQSSVSRFKLDRGKFSGIVGRRTFPTIGLPYEDLPHDLSRRGLGSMAGTSRSGRRAAGRPSLAGWLTGKARARIDKAICDTI